MAITQTLLDFDEYFISTSGDKIIVNDLNAFALTDSDKVHRNLMTVYDSDVISTVPSCDCGYYNKRFRLNKICPNCGTQVTEPFKKVKPLLWLKAFGDEYKFMNPSFWLMLKTVLDRKSLKNSKYDYVRWLSDSTYNPPINIPSYILGLKNLLGGVRTYPNMVNNIENILIYLMNHGSFKEFDKQQTLIEMLELYKTNKDKIFNNYLPIINKKMFVMENTNMGKFTNIAVSDVIDVVSLWVKTSTEIKQSGATDRKVSTVTVNTISKLANLYTVYFNKYLLEKPGAIRKHVYGARSSFTFRSVIISINKPHKHDEIEVPWAIGVTAFRLHLLNKLVNQRGFTYKKASSLLFKCVKKHDPLVEELLQELIDESPDKGIPVVLHRNPSLLQGSTMLVRIGKFKSDPKDLTIGMSVLIVKPFNADFDGDELNVMILLDNYMADLFKTLKPYYNIPDMSKPFSVSGNLTLLSPANNILSNYLSDRTEYPSVDTIINELI